MNQYIKYFETKLLQEEERLTKSIKGDYVMWDNLEVIKLYKELIKLYEEE